MTTRIEFKLDIDNDFSSEEISQSETNTDDVFVITGTPFDLNNPEKPQALNDKDGV